jgi:hypothetical protein
VAAGALVASVAPALRLLDQSIVGGPVALVLMSVPAMAASLAADLDRARPRFVLALATGACFIMGLGWFIVPGIVAPILLRAFWAPVPALTSKMRLKAALVGSLVAVGAVIALELLWWTIGAQTFGVSGLQATWFPYAILGGALALGFVVSDGCLARAR